MDNVQEQPKKRGRPRGGLTQNQADNARTAVEKPREESAHGRKSSTRVPMSAGSKLAVANKDPGMMYRWFADKPGRIDQALAAWWDFELDSGEKVKRASGEDTLYLMKIDKKYWNEDQKLKNQQVVDTLRKEQELAADEYIPDGRSHVLQKDDDYDPLS